MQCEEVNCYMIHNYCCESWECILLISALAIPPNVAVTLLIYVVMGFDIIDLFSVLLIFPISPFHSFSACSRSCQNGGTRDDGACTCVCAESYSGDSCESELVRGLTEICK